MNFDRITFAQEALKNAGWLTRERVRAS